MKRSNYSISIITHDENFSGCTITKEKYIASVKNFLATADTIRETIKNLFPAEEIDEKDKSIFEQIHDTFTLGFFKIKLKSSIEFSSKGIMFDEIQYLIKHFYSLLKKQGFFIAFFAAISLYVRFIAT